MRRLIAIFLFGIIVFGLYHYGLIGFKEEPFSYHYFDDFESLNREFWYAGEWETFFPAYDKVIMEDGAINLTVNQSNRGPFLLSEPIEIEKASIVTIKRKVLVHYGNENFTGGFALLQTDDENLRPKVLTDHSGGLGKGIALVEYVHNYNKNSTRPGRDIFRFMMPNWEEAHNYELIDPIFDKWFTEVLTYNTENGIVTYQINDEIHTLRGYPLKLDRVRVFMHAYGLNTGHTMKMESFEIKIEDIN